ncbi:MAG: penicillin-binding protein 2 [Gammaproteobacteria bacterium]
MAHMQKKRITIKNHHREIQLIAQRSIIALIFLCALVFLLIARLAYLQIHKNEDYSTQATNNWLDLVPIEPSRGLIYDRNGLLLAENTPVFSLVVVPFETPNMLKMLPAISKIITLSDSDINQFQRQVKLHRRFEEIQLKLRLTEEEVARFAENQHRFPGFVVKARLMRHYPYNETFSHVIGYQGRINTQDLNEIDQSNYGASHYIGKSGIEKYYEEELHGRTGYQRVENDASGKPLRILKEIHSTPGKNLYLTIDSQLQFIAEKALNGHRGAVVALQPATGQVLAMVSKPGYDPNLFVLGINQADYAKLHNSADRPLYNRALRGLYPPASTIKPYFALQGLDTNIVNEDYTISDPGWFQLRNNNHKFRDWKKKGHGQVDIGRAITSSCDIYFFELATRLGIKRMDDILNQFGYGAPTGIDLDDELAGTVASPEWKRKMKHEHWYEGDTVISGIGQGFMQATPLQLANAVAIMANRGQRFMPYLLMGEQAPGSEYNIQQPIPLESVTLRNKENWDIVIDAMQDVVETPGGTAFRFGKRPYTVAAKTGTAQVIAKRGNPEEVDNQSTIPERFRDHHLFIAFAPIEKPEIALAIISENSNVAIETARAMLDYYLGTKHARQPQAKTEKTNA